MAADKDPDQRIRDLGYKVAIGTLFVAPAIMLMPPRKLDFYTFGLGFAWVYCFNHVVEAHGVSPFRRQHQFLSKENEEMRRRRAEEESGMSISARMQKDLMEVWNSDRKKNAEAREKTMEAERGNGVLKGLEELKRDQEKE